MPNHMSFYYTHSVCNPCPFSCNYSQVAEGRHAVIVFEGGMAVAKIDFRWHICTEEFEFFSSPPLLSSPQKRTLSFSELAAPGVVCFLLFFQLESIDLTEWRAISDISPSSQACGVICWRFSAALCEYTPRPANPFRSIIAYDFSEYISSYFFFLSPRKVQLQTVEGHHLLNCL